MEILEKAKNGQVCNALKSYKELTIKERQELARSYENYKDRFDTFQVKYTKKGKLLSACPFFK